MQKKNRIFMRVVAMLLCVVMATTCLVSTIFARYVTRDKASIDGVKLKKWGITIDTGSHAKRTYTDESGNTVVATKETIGSANAIAPGMRGSLAWFHVFGSPEVKYKINFDGNISIGDGYDDAVVNSNEEPLAYFPIVLYLVAYDVTYEGDEMKLNRTTSTNAKGSVMDFAQSHLRKEGDVRNTLASTEASDSGNVLSWQPVSSIEDTFNGYNTIYDYMSLDNCFDQFDLSGSTDRVYALEWCWPYNHDASYPRSDEPNFKQGRYLYSEYDTQLGEKMRERKGTDDFDITLEMSVTVEQSNETFIDEDVVDRVHLGSFPQSLVQDTTLEAELDKKAEGLTWSEKNYTSNRAPHYRFVDVEHGGDKYRGFKYYSDDPDPNNKPPNLILYCWFKYEPISWIVLEDEEEDGKAFLFSEFMLDKRLYQDVSRDTTLWDTGSGEFKEKVGFPENTYLNNWEYSTIRKWLNETFYQTAFNEPQRSMLLVTEVDNSAATTNNSSNNSFARENTEDKIFFLSYKEMTEQYSELKGIILKDNVTTDYSFYVFSGNKSSLSFTRSPNSTRGDGVSLIGYYDTGTSTWFGADKNYDVNDARGVRPVMWVELYN